MIWNQNAVLILVSLMAKDAEHFLRIYWPFIFLHLKGVCSVYLPIVSGIF
jgi:hypothetical protein